MKVKIVSGERGKKISLNSKQKKSVRMYKLLRFPFPRENDNKMYKCTLFATNKFFFANNGKKLQ